MADYGNPKHNTQPHRGDGVSLGGVLTVLGIIVAATLLLFIFGGDGAAPLDGTTNTPAVDQSPATGAVPTDN